MFGSGGALGSNLFVLESKHCLQYWPQSSDYGVIRLWQCCFLSIWPRSPRRVCHSDMRHSSIRFFQMVLLRNNYLVKHPAAHRVRPVYRLAEVWMKPKMEAAQLKMSRISISSLHALTGTDCRLHIRLWCNTSHPIHSHFNSHCSLSATRTQRLTRRRQTKEAQAL